MTQMEDLFNKIAKSIYNVTSRYTNLSPIFIFIFFSLSLISLHWILGPFSYFPMHDAGDSHIPRNIAAAFSFKEYGLQRFFPFQNAGVDQWASDLTPWHPVNILFFFFPIWIAYPLALIIHHTISGWLTYLFSIKILRFDKLIAIITGFFFSYCFPYNIDSQYAFTVFPGILLLIQLMPENKKMLLIIISSLGIGVIYSLLSSLPWGVPFTVPILCLWTIISFPKNYKKTLAAILFSLASVSAQLPIILSMATNSPSSHRATWIKSFPTFLEVLTNIPKEFFFGTAWLPNILALFFLLSKNKSNSKFKYIKSVIFLFLLTIVVFPFIPYLKSHFIDHLGPLSGFNFSRLAKTAPFFSSLLAGAFLQNHFDNSVLKKEWKTKAHAITTIILICLFSFKYFQQAKTWIFTGSYKSVYMSPQLKSLYKNNLNSPPYRVAKVGWYADTLMAYNFESLPGYGNLFPLSFLHFWKDLLKDSSIKKRANHSRMYIFLPISHNSDSINFSKYYDLNLLSLANTKFLVSDYKLVSPDLRLISSPRKNWFSLTKKEKLIERIYQNFNGKTYYIYENKLSLPRFYLSNSLDINDSEQVIKNAVEDKNVVNIINYTPDKIDLELVSISRKYLIFSQNYYKHWKVKVDGQNRDILKSYKTFMAIKLFENDKKVTFSYSP